MAAGADCGAGSASGESAGLPAIPRFPGQARTYTQASLPDFKGTRTRL